MTSQPTDGAVEAPSCAFACDAPIAVFEGLVFVTTGQSACDQLGESPTQIALTPVVAERIAEVLRVILQYPDLGNRRAILDEWNAGEATVIPHGRVTADAHCVRVGIEPLGAGAAVAVPHGHVPGFAMGLDQAAAALRPR